MTSRVFVFTILMFLAIGCSTGYPGDGIDECAGGKCDEQPEPENDCPVATSFGDLGSMSDVERMSDAGLFAWLGDIASEPNPTSLYVEVLAGVTTGTYNLADQSQYKDCEVCVRVVADTNGDRDYNQSYMAVDGQLKIEAVAAAPSGFSATLSNATFAEVEINWDTFESVESASGCTTSVSSVEMTREN